MDRLRPWPSRAERQAAIDAAREGRQRSQAELEHARGVVRDIERDARSNHYSGLIAWQITAGRGHRNGGT